MTHVLIIDDDEINNYTIEAMLEKTSFVNEYVVRDSGASALEYLSQADTNEQFPNYIFVDINMPEMNGYQFLEHYEKDFQKKYPNTYVYTLSSSISEFDRERSHSFDCVNEFISKPLSRSKLRELVRD